MGFYKFAGYILVLCALVGCAKEEEEELPILVSPTSVYAQANPLIRIKYGSLLQLKNDPSSDGRTQTLSLVPIDTRPEIALDPRLEIQYFSSLEGVTGVKELLDYLNAASPEGKWVESSRFKSSGFYQVVPDPDNRQLTMTIHYLLSDRDEVYRITVKPGSFGEVRDQISAAWQSLEIELKTASTLLPLHY